MSERRTDVRGAGFSTIGLGIASWINGPISAEGLIAFGFLMIAAHFIAALANTDPAP